MARLLRIKLPLDNAVDHLIEQLCDEIREVITAELMTLELPSGVLRLGRTMTTSYPVTLQSLDYEPLAQLLTRLELPVAIAADERDWSDLAYRMFFIARLFRVYHEQSELLQGPFTPEQLAELRAGRWAH